MSQLPADDDFLFGFNAEILAQFLANSTLPPAVIANFHELLKKGEKNLLSVTDLIAGLGIIIEILKDKSCAASVSNLAQRFFDNCIKKGYMRQLDSIFEPHGNLLVGLEPQLDPLSPTLGTYPPSQYGLIIIPGFTGSILNGVSTQRYWVDAVGVLGGTYEANLRTTVQTSTVSPPSTSVSSVKTVTVPTGINGVCDLSPWGLMSGFAALREAVNPSYIDAVPYDWRIMPAKTDTGYDSYADFEAKLISSINNMVVGPIGQTFLLAHSAGNLLLAYFLHKNASNTVLMDKLKGVICVSPTFGGCGAAIDAITNGAQKVVTVSPTFMGALPQVAWSLPNVIAYDNSTPVVIYNQPYYASNIGQFLQDYAPTTQTTFPIYQNIIQSLGSSWDYLTTKPVPPVYLITSSYGSTPAGYKYIDSQVWLPIPEVATNGNVGDGTVPYLSLHALDTYWDITSAQQLQIPNINHTEIISNSTFINAVMNLLATGNLPSS